MFDGSWGKILQNGKGKKKLAKLNYSFISHLDFKWHWRGSNQEPKIYILFWEEGVEKFFCTSLHFIELAANRPTNCSSEPPLGQGLFITRKVSVMGFYMQCKNTSDISTWAYALQNILNLFLNRVSDTLKRHQKRSLWRTVPLF